MAAAFELSRPQHEGKYRVTVYQQGFRLGGKGASGRGPNGRIEEHGLHLWMGFYENAFRQMRECYEELDRDPANPMARWTDAFVPDHFCGVMDRSPQRGWLPWTTHFPPRPGSPGDPMDGQAPWSVASYAARSVELLGTVLEAVRVRAHAASTGGQAASAPGRDLDLQVDRNDARSVESGLERVLKYGNLASVGAVLQGLSLLEAAVVANPILPNGPVLALTDMLKSSTRSLLETLTASDDELRRLWELADLMLAIVRGFVADGLIMSPNGFDKIDNYDCKEWLIKHGAAPSSAESGFVRGLYDLAFGYEDGDVERPRIAAGQALRGAMRAFFTYRGAFFWKMQAGMGDIVFSPYYEVLKKRGVRFEFFHRLENVGLVPAEELKPGEAPYVQSLRFDVQARLKAEGEYQPLVDVGGLPCWPAEPDYAQLQDGERFEREGWQFESWFDTRKVDDRTLRVGEDFDMVVLGVGLGAVPHVCPELIERSDRWRTMVDHCKTVATQALQVWLNEDQKQLGWDAPEINISGYVEPFDTWANMDHLIRAEAWSRPPRSIAYFCSVLQDPEQAPSREDRDYPARRYEEVFGNARTFLERDVGVFWPNARRGARDFRWEVLETGEGDRPEHADARRLRSQFWTANVSPTDRYSLALPGSLQYRISPLDMTFDNLTIAGDWTDCGFNEGCVEAAAMSGLLAAHAISGLPRLEDIVGYDHP